MRVLGPFPPASLPGAGLPSKQVESGLPDKPVLAGKATTVTPFLVNSLPALSSLGRFTA